MYKRHKRYEVVPLRRRKIDMYGTASSFCSVHLSSNVLHLPQQVDRDEQQETGVVESPKQHVSYLSSTANASKERSVIKIRYTMRHGTAAEEQKPAEKLKMGNILSTLKKMSRASCGHRSDRAACEKSRRGNAEGWLCSQKPAIDRSLPQTACSHPQRPQRPGLRCDTRLTCFGVLSSDAVHLHLHLLVETVNPLPSLLRCVRINTPLCHFPTKFVSLLKRHALQSWW